jgi:CBS domain-containing protein
LIPDCILGAVFDVSGFFETYRGAGIQKYSSERKIVMLVKRWMSKEVITIDANDSMSDAMDLLKEHDIKMLPVMEKSKLVGIVTDRDLKRASASDATSLNIHELLYLISKIKIKDIMTKNPITVPEDYTVEETAEILLKHKISGVPVVDHYGDMVGIITKNDLFRIIISLTGVERHSIWPGGRRSARLHQRDSGHDSTIRRPYGEHPDFLRYGSRRISPDVYSHVWH